jgi:hypothetical protein
MAKEWGQVNSIGEETQYGGYESRKEELGRSSFHEDHEFLV